ncbi:MAG: sporulation protein YunB, partial [Clostridia bacterium]|nr:sporulation protein YunB [Clostridia bacterium]
INQTKYSLSVKVTVPARIAGVFRYEDTKVVTEIPLAETILVGEVPKAYLAH